MTRQRIGPAALLALALVLAPATARAHVAPSATENNRYIKVTLLPDHVRLSYTVFFGERPGAGERQRMDCDGNGQLDDDETKRFGASLRDDVAGHLRLVVDGAVLPAARLTVEDVGLGTPLASGGAFSVDLLLDAPTQGPGAHALTVEDTWIVPSPGESELVLEDAPGVRLVASRLAGEPATNQARWAFRGNPESAAARSVQAQWTVDDTAYREAVAAHPGPPAAPSHRGLWLALAALVVGALAFFVLSRPKASRA